MRRRRTSAACLLVAALVVDALALSRAAEAAPYPGQDDVTRAEQAEAGARDDVAGIEKQLAAAAARARAADVALSSAAEDYDVAVIELRRSGQDAEQAQQAADKAGTRVDEAQVQVGRLAADTYRRGGPIADLDVLLSPGGPDAVLERATMLQTLASGRNRSVHALDTARVSANALQRRADLALARKKQAADRLAAAKATAVARAAGARAVVAQTAATQQDLLAELARARRTTVAVERARQEGLERAAQEAAERKARQEAEARAAAQRRASSSSSPSSSSSSSSGGSSGGADSGRSDAPTGSSSGSSGGGSSAVAWARRQLGLPYLWGGDGPNSYDCSGLTMRAWQRAGVSLPHSSRMQYQQVQKIPYSSMRPGDLLFYATNTGNAGTIHHVTMYVGGGMMIEAPYTGARVRVVPVRRGESMPYAGRP